jgi:hypothetical protein
MKKIIYCFLVISLTLSVFSIQSLAATIEKPSSLVATKPVEPVETTEVKTLLNSVEVSNKLDKTTLSTNEKKNVQVEVRDRGRHYRHGGGVIYVSAGTVILIIILLVILL